ncbi:MAG TPA: hypothetical protein DDZ41_06915, partial [Flavobacterium sp.]|nr:hypothetical protein [Flavobacterium sp.]
MRQIELRESVIIFLGLPPKSKIEQFNKAFELYRKSANKNLGVELRLNRSGFTEEGLENLLYDLKKLHQISDVDVLSYLKKNETHKDIFENLVESSEAIIKSFKPKNDTFDDFVPIRKEYPFLNDKDCPDELFIVVGKKIAAWKRYQELHEKIQNFDGEKNGEEVLTQLTAQATAEYEENKALESELKYYAEHKEVLAAHPVLVELRIKKDVEAMSNAELHKYVQSSK